MMPSFAGNLLARAAPISSGLNPTLVAIATFLVAVSAYWIASALAFLFYATRRRSGMADVLVSAAGVWLILRALGAVLRVLMPCIAPDAESSFGFVVAVVATYLLPLRTWQRALCLAIVGLTAATWAYASGCRVPGVLALAAGIVALGALLLWLLMRYQRTRALLQPLGLALDNWGTRLARTPLTPTILTVLEARLRQHLGFTLEDIEPIGAAGVHTSTPLRVRGRGAGGGEQRYFVKIVSGTNWRSSLFYEIAAWLQNRGRVRAGPLWPTLQSLVEYEHYMLLLCSEFGVPAPQPRGIYRLERRIYTLVTDFLEDAESLRGMGQVSERYVRNALLGLQRLREADLAHRDLKASNLMVLPGEGFAFVDLALALHTAGPRHLARDLANMLVVLAMHHEPARVVEMARDILGLEGLRAARAYLRTARLVEETQQMLPLELPGELLRLINGLGYG